MTIATAKNTPRNTYTATGGQTVFTIGFEFFATGDIKVFRNGTALTFNASPSSVAQFSVQGTANASDSAYEFGAGGTVTLGAGATADDSIVIVRDIVVERTTDFTPAASFDVTALNTQLDVLMAMMAEREESTSRSLRLPLAETTTNFDMQLPVKATRANKILEFDNDGNPSAALSSTNFATLGTITSDISAVAAVASNVTTVAGIASNVTAVAGDSTDIGAVAAVATEIGRLGTSDAVADLAILGTSAIVTDMDLLATSANVTAMGHLGTSANVTAMGLLGTSAVVADMALLGTSDVVADMALLANSDVIADMAILATSDIVSDINTLATSDIVSDLNTLATSDIVSDINTLATSAIVADLNILATSDIVTDINLLATSDVVSDLNTLATSDFVSDLNTLASSTVVNNIATVASNVAGVNSFAARYRVAGSDPGSDNDAGDLVFNTSSNILKVYNGSSFEDVTGTTLAGLNDVNVTSPADGSILLYDTSTSKYIDNVLSGDATLADTGVLTLTANSVDSDQYVDGSIDTIHIADGQITATKLAADAVSTSLRQNVNPLIINGDMQVAQRGTSFSASTAEIYTLDRFKYIDIDSTDNVYTITQDSDVPSGQGFAKSLKVDVATADASLDSLDGTLIEQRIEAQDLQQLSFGTSSAKSLTLAFWVKSNKTGTYVVRLLQSDNSSKQVSYAYTISSANTWEKKVVNIPGDTAGVITNDNGSGLQISWLLSAGAGLQSGALRSAWTAYANGDVAPGQVNLADSTSNEWYLTGVQLEVGTFDANSIAPFQHESFGDSLMRCERYCKAITKEANYAPVMLAHGVTADVCRGAYFFQTPMRAAPSFTHTGNIIRSFDTATAASSATAVSSRFSHSIDWTASGLFAANEGILMTFNTTAASLIYSAEL